VPARHGVKAKQCWYGLLVALQGVMLLAIGLTNSSNPATLIGLVAGMACFMVRRPYLMRATL
jgi:hypothetical protein